MSFRVRKDGAGTVLFSHVVAVRLGLVVQTAGVVDGHGVAFVGDVGAVAGLEGLFGDSHDVFFL